MELIKKYESKATKLMLFHGLNDWCFNFNKGTSMLGLCEYDKKRISVSINYVNTHPEHVIMDTILHEIAHALTPNHGHDNVWKEKAKQIGCVGERLYHKDLKVGVTYKGTCPTCGNSIIKNKRVGFCGDCYNTQYFTKIETPHRYNWEEVKN